MRENKHERGKRRRLQSFEEVYEALVPRGDDGEPVHGFVPEATEAERNVLGAMLMNESAVQRAIAIIGRPKFEDLPFLREPHAWIYQAMCDVDARGEKIDTLTVGKQLEREGKLGYCGHYGGLTQLIIDTVTSANVEAHCQMLLEAHAMREFTRVTYTAYHNAFTGLISVKELLMEMDSEASKIMAMITRDTQGLRQAKYGTLAAVERMETLAKSEGGLLGISTGLSDLDALTLGWQEANLIVLAARPGMGKTALANKFALTPVLEDKPDTWVAYFSLEMSTTAILVRMLASIGKIDLKRLKQNKLTDKEWMQLSRAAARLSDAPLFIDDRSSLTVSDIRAQVKRLHQRMSAQGYKRGMVIVDYVGLLSSSEKVFDRNDEVSKHIRGLNALKKEIPGLSVIALNQLSRKVEDRKGCVPQPSDLRDSGEIEQAADLIIFIYRPEYYHIDVDEDGNSNKGLAKLIVPKQRDGEVSEVRCTFIGEQQRFEDRIASLYDGVAPPVEEPPSASFVGMSGGPAF